VKDEANQNTLKTLNSLKRGRQNHTNQRRQIGNAN